MGRHGENIRKRKDGRWEARYLSYDTGKGNKTYRSVYGHTYEETKTKRDAVLRESELQTGNPVPSSLRADTLSMISFDEAAQAWMKLIKLGQKQSTCEKYGFIYHSFLQRILGHIPLVQITERLVREKLESLEVTSASVWKSIYCVLNGILRHSAEHYHVTLPEFKRTAKAIRRNEAAVFTKSEQARLLSALYTNTDRFKLGVLLCLFTGLRIGELCALKWEDIDFANKTLCVKRTVQRLYVGNGGKKTALVESPPKSLHSKRELPLPDALITFLQNFQNGKAYIFGAEKPLDPRTMQNHYRKIIEEAGVAYKNFHVLRHTYATNCMEGGTDVKSLSEMLGHSNVKTTLNYYVHPSMDTKRIYADNLCAFYVMLYGQILGRAG